ncbi:hypothetical protein CYMTET_18643 [Cymbomonas tetramitiformis]|uniref:F-box/LRR-repeat protein 15-like leucin rich repeat domain-containing protein n=1 Tax=Cymbomonas tetramitiformis TaxID=36881 RepID=A0AAE0G7L0_9CHLO|nr:hypothetical protein CYMTET_18643 [Cymbomonas tetramitiformis]
MIAKKFLSGNQLMSIEHAAPALRLGDFQEDLLASILSFTGPCVRRLLRLSGVSRHFRRCVLAALARMGDAELSDKASCSGVHSKRPGCAFHEPELQDATLVALVARGAFLQLSSLSLTNCACLTDAGLMELARGAPVLRALRLQGCGKLTARGLEQATRCCPLLETLHLGSSLLRPHADGEQLEQEALRNALRDLPHLRALSARYLTDAVAVEAARSCPQLRELRLMDPRITNSGIAALALHGSGISRLCLGGWVGVSDAALLAVGQGCSGLRDLGLGGFPENRQVWTEAGLRALARCCPLLEALSVDNCQGQLTDGALEAVARACAHLRVVSANRCGRTLTDAGMSAVAEHCDNLQELRVAFTDATDVGVQRVAERCTQLRVVVVGRVTDANLCVLGRSCPWLQEVHVVRRCARLTNKGLQALAKGCPELRALCVRGVAATDLGLKAVAEGCPKLRWLDLSFCTAVTSEGLMAVAKGCPALEIFCCLQAREHQGCLLQAGILELVQKCTRLEQLSLPVLPMDLVLRVVQHGAALTTLSFAAGQQFTREDVESLLLSQLPNHSCEMLGSKTNYELFKLAQEIGKHSRQGPCLCGKGCSKIGMWAMCEDGFGGSSIGVNVLDPDEHDVTFYDYHISNTTDG